MDFITRKLGIDKSELTDKTTIEDDVGLAELDTYIFYDDFFVEFEISNPKDFNVDEYVSPTIYSPFLILKGIFSKKARNKMKSKSTTIEHLTKVAMEKKWREPIL